MCWSAGVSLNTFILVCFAAVLGALNHVNTLWQTAFLLTYGSMQLIEYFLWTHIGSPQMNRAFSMVGLFAIMLQPLVSIMRLDACKSGAHRNGLLLVYAAFAAAVLYLCAFTRRIDFRSTQAANGHLAWHWLTSMTSVSGGLLLLIWMLLFFAPIVLCKHYLAAGFGLCILLISIFTYWKHETWGSMWCWAAAMASLYYIFQAFYVSGWCDTRMETE